MERLRPFFPKSHGRPRVDDRKVLTGITFIDRNEVRRREAASAFGPEGTLDNRSRRWSERGVSARKMEGLAAGDAEPLDTADQRRRHLF